MESIGRRYRGIAFYILIGCVFYVAYVVVEPFIPALLWATVLSVLMMPFNNRLRSRFSDNASALLTTVLALAFIGVPLMLAAFTVYLQTASVLADASKEHHDYSIRALARQADGALAPLTDRLGIDQGAISKWAVENRSKISEMLSGSITKAVRGIGFSFLTMVTAFLTMFFMLRDGGRLREPALELLPIPRERSLEILDQIGKTIRAVFVGVVLVAILQGCLAGLAYALCGVPHPVIWGAVTIVLCTIPAIGPTLVYVPIAAWLLLSGRYVEGIGLIVFLLIVSSLDHFLRSLLISSQTSLHSIGIFFSILGGIIVFGPIGIMAGPMILTVTLALIDVLRESRVSGAGTAGEQKALQGG